MTHFLTAEQVISHLDCLTRRHPRADLTEIKSVLQVLQNPQNQVKTVHVTGTNGKGSTSYYVSQLLKKAGQKTGLFVSPYIFEFNERIQINGQNISEENLVIAANRVECAILQLKKSDANFSLTTFEFETAMAFWYFAEEKCDYAVIEVGIGGEHDKTNVITPQVSIITTVAMDHEKIIGPTLEDIAIEKSGIIKFKRPVILGNVPDRVLALLLTKARSQQAPVYRFGKDFNLLGNNCFYNHNNQQKLSFKARQSVENIDIAVALAAFAQLDLSLSDNQIEQAINQTVIPARYQVVQKQPLIIVDGAHNPQAMASLLQEIRDKQTKLSGHVFALVMVMKDKNMSQIFAQFSPEDEVILTRLNYPRAAKFNDFPKEIRDKYHFEADFKSGFMQLKQKAKNQDIILITGSFYLAGAFLNWIKQKGVKNVG